MSNQVSPLFHPVHYRGKFLDVLDETLLPYKEKYIKVRALKDVLYVLGEMKTRAYGQVLLYYYFALLSAKQKKIKDFKQLERHLEILTKEFSRKRPTFGFGQFQDHILGMAKIVKPGDFLALLEKSIVGYINQIENLRLNRAKILAKLLPDNPKILTHCNVSGELVALGQELKRQNRNIEFFVTETRPYLQGARLTAWELATAGFHVHLLCDIQTTSTCLKNNISAVVVGSDRSTAGGDIVNKVGTYQLAVIARHFDIPFYCLAQAPGKTKAIKDIEIEYRPAEELLKFKGEYIAPKNQKVLYPSFDITPKELVTKLVFFDGAYTPEDFKKKWKS